MMKPEQVESLREIASRIYECRECDVHRDAAELLKGLNFKCDPPTNIRVENNYRVVIVGINPHWGDDTKEDYSEVLSAANYDEFESQLNEYNKRHETTGSVGRYQYGITSIFNLFNQQLGILNDGDVEAKDIYKHVFWANLSFCGSADPYNRKVYEKDLPCRVFSEEIPNCLSKGYLRDIVNIIKPELILVLASSALSYIYYKNALKSIYGKDQLDEFKFMDKTYPSQTRKGKIIEVTIVSCKADLETNATKVVFFPHPNYRFNGDMKKDAIKEICNWLKKQVTLSL